MEYTEEAKLYFEKFCAVMGAKGIDGSDLAARDAAAIGTYSMTFSDKDKTSRVGRKKAQGKWEIVCLAESTYQLYQTLKFACESMELKNGN